MLQSRCRMFRQTKFAVPSEFFPIAFADCSSNLVACRNFISLVSLYVSTPCRSSKFTPYQGLMVSALVPAANGPGSSPGRGHCVVFLGKTLYSHSAPLHAGV